MDNPISVGFEKFHYILQSQLEGHANMLAVTVVGSASEEHKLGAKLLPLIIVSTVEMIKKSWEIQAVGDMQTHIFDITMRLHRKHVKISQPLGGMDTVGVV